MPIDGVTDGIMGGKDAFHFSNELRRYAVALAQSALSLRMAAHRLTTHTDLAFRLALMRSMENEPNSAQLK